MPRSRFLALVLLALACGLAWVLWGTGVEGRAPSSAANRARSPQRIEAGELDAASAPAREYARSDAAAPSAQRSELDAARTSDDDLLVLVRRRATGEPVPGATVRWFDFWSAESQAFPDEFCTEFTLERALEARGSAATTGPDGALRIPRPRGPTDIFARSGDEWSEGGISTRHFGPLVLELESPRWVRVRVVDAHGRARAGVPVALATTQLGQQSRYWTSSTDAHGLARCQMPRDVLQIDSDRRFVACLDLPLRELVECEFDPRAPPTEILQLVLPPTGTLRVRVLEPDGQPSTSSGKLHLSLDTEELRELADRGLLPTARSRSSFEFPYRGGELVLAHIGLDLEFDVQDRSRALDPGPFGCVQGPSAPGQEVVFELARGVPPPFVSGRAIEAETGTPLADVQLQVSLIGPISDFSERVRTDAQGVFRASWHHWIHRQETPSLHVAAWRGREGERETRVELPPHVQRRDWDLGEVALPLLPVLAAGRVVAGESGLPLQGVLIELALREEASDDKRTEEARWLSEYRRSVVTNSRGEFLLRRERPERAARLHLSKPGYFSASSATTFEPGDEQLELRMERGGVVEGRVLLAEGTSPAQLDVELTREVREGIRGSYHPEFEADGSFRIEGIVPGRYTLYSPVRHSLPSRIEIRGIEVEAGKTAADPRLAAIDARELHFLNIELRVLNPSGDRVHSADVYVLDPTGTRIIEEVHVSDGFGRLQVPGSALDLRIRSAGLRTQTIRRVSANLTIQLEAPLLAELQLVHDHPPGTIFELCLMPAEPEREPHEAAPAVGRELEPEWAHCIATDGRSARVKLPAAGRWNVHGWCQGFGHDEEHHGFWPRLVDGAESLSLEVLDRPGLQFFSVEFAPAEREGEEHAE